MKFFIDSIKKKIVFSVLFIICGIVLTLVLISLKTNSDVRHTVQNITKETLHKTSVGIMESRSFAQALSISAPVNEAKLVAQTIAADIAQFYRQYDAGEFTDAEARKKILDKVYYASKAQPQYMGIISAFAPNTFGDDALFTQKGEKNRPLGMLDNGRITPYWYWEEGVIPPFLTSVKSRRLVDHNNCLGGIPPIDECGRSLLYVHCH